MCQDCQDDGGDIGGVDGITGDAGYRPLLIVLGCLAILLVLCWAMARYL